jgi:hypothetical protein
MALLDARAMSATVEIRLRTLRDWKLTGCALLLASVMEGHPSFVDLQGRVV